MFSRLCILLLCLGASLALPLAGAQVVAVCDVWRNKREGAAGTVAQHYGAKGGDAAKACQAYNDFRELLAEEREGHVDDVHDGHLHHVAADGTVDEHSVCVATPCASTRTVESS